MPRTVTVSLADLEGIPHGANAGTSVTIEAAYTSEVVLLDGTIIPDAKKVKGLLSNGVREFSITRPSERAEPYRMHHRRHLGSHRAHLQRFRPRHHRHRRHRRLDLPRHDGRHRQDQRDRRNLTGRGSLRPQPVHHQDAVQSAVTAHDWSTA